MEHTKEMLTEKVKKSQLHAKSNYDFHKLRSAGEHFLPMNWEEDAETVSFQYEIGRMTSFSEIRKEDKVVIFNILMQIAKFETDREDYSFSIEPANLFYNSNGQVCIKQRDLTVECEENFTLEYKALIACALTGEYTFKDYLEGGEDLLKKNKAVKQFFELSDTEEIVEHLEQLKKEYLERQKKRKVSVNRVGNRILKISAVFLLILTIVLGTYSGIQYFDTIPYLTAVTAADNAYIENNNIALIDALKSVEVERMDKHQKYILARAYLQSENLSDEQKKNVLEKLTLTANEKELEYWILLGRLDVTSAEDLALQLSDDELLLYAYMKEKAQIQADTAISGTEKEQRIQEVQSKIDSLAKKYDLED